jgi:hypothetical protein
MRLVLQLLRASNPPSWLLLANVIRKKVMITLCEKRHQLAASLRLLLTIDQGCQIFLGA